jgi:hypothetical protein
MKKVSFFSAHTVIENPEKPMNNKAGRLVKIID